ncbi:MAG: hypothetical protein E7402_00335 [Ruminococcaceae bacterium]|nr:hypothetical protein [Oscillospiraceae bacterium]
MLIFNLTLTQMLMMFLFIATGILLQKTRILPDNADMTMSRLQLYVFTPAQNFFAMSTHCSVKNFADNAYLIGFGFVIIVAFIVLSYPLSALFVKDHAKSKELSYQRNIYKYALAYGNYSYLANFMILGIWNMDVLFKYSMFKLPLDILCNTWALSVLIPKGGVAKEPPIKKLLRSFSTPPIIALVAGMIVGLTGLTKYIPEFVNSAMDNGSKCMGPVAMLIAGFVIGRYRLPDLFSSGKIYILSALRLIILPGALLLLLRLMHASSDVITFSLLSCAVPIGMNTIVYPATFGGDTHTGACMTMTSSVLAVITLPLMFLLFIG